MRNALGIRYSRLVDSSETIRVPLWSFFLSSCSRVLAGRANKTYVDHPMLALLHVLPFRLVRKISHYLELEILNLINPQGAKKNSLDRE